MRRADHPALGLCLDSFHVLTRGGGLAGVRAIPGDKVFALQLADAPQLTMDTAQWSRHHRLFPGQGSLPVAAVLTIGYRGPLALEVSALAVETADPAASATRAERLLAPVVPRRRQPDEADLSSVAAPDGTTVFFCRTGGPDNDWLADFALTGAEPGTAGLLTGIDHVSLTEPFDDFDQATLFYRTVLGLEPQPATELAAPFGLIRSRAVTDRDLRVRMTLNAALFRRGEWAPAVPEPQHIAFASTDVIASARALRAMGAPLLEIPGNYYDDLDARLDLPPDLLATMRELSVLYDRDSHGEYLHVCTETPADHSHPPASDRPRGPPRPRLLGRPPVRPHALPTRTDRGGGRRRLPVCRPPPHQGHPGRTPPPHRNRPRTAEEDQGRAGHHRRERPRRGTRENRPARRPDAVPAPAGSRRGTRRPARHHATPDRDRDRNRKTEHFALLCDLAAPLGLTIDLEFPSWTETPNLTEATHVLHAADRPNAGMLIDLLHFAHSQSSIDELRALPREWFHFAHVCDAPARIPSTVEVLIHTARYERLFPSEGGIDVTGILAALPPDVPYALEIPRASLTAQVGEKECIRQAIVATRQHLKKARVGT